MDEPVQAVQNEETETPTTEQPQVEETKTPEVPQEPEAEQPQEDKEAKKQRDFEKATYKFRDLYKQERDKRIALEKQQQQPAPVQTDDDIVEVDGRQEALQLLETVVQKAVAPIMEEKIWDEFEKQPFVKELQPEIMAELKNIPESQPLQARLAQARAYAIANNVGTIAKVYRESGVEQAYQNQALKKGQMGTQQTPAKSPEPRQSLMEKIKSNNITEDEYRENYDEIQKIYKEELGIS